MLKVIHITKDGKRLEDIQGVQIPADSPAYMVIRNYAERKARDGQAPEICPEDLPEG